MSRPYCIDHLVTLEETNFLGNVYFVNHLRWQGQCRERFLNDYTPEVVDELQTDLVLLTTACGCEYFGELRAFDLVRIGMRLAEVRQNRIFLTFDYTRVTDQDNELVARGTHQIAVMRRSGQRLIVAPIPEALSAAFREFERTTNV